MGFAAAKLAAGLFGDIVATALSRFGIGNITKANIKTVTEQMLWLAQGVSVKASAVAIEVGDLAVSLATQPEGSTWWDRHLGQGGDGPLGQDPDPRRK